MNLRRPLDLALWTGKSAVWMAGSLMLLLLDAAPARAATVCEVKVPRLNMRERPSMSARIFRVLDGRTQLITVGGCNAGWVRVVSDLGATRGYVGGWALREVTQERPSPGASLKKGAAVAAFAAAAPGVTAGSESSRTENAPSMPPAGVSQQKLGSEELDSGEPGTSGADMSATWVFNPEEGHWSHHTSKGGSATSTEALAVQMTENRLKVLALERRMQLVERALAQLQGGQGQ